MNTSVKKLLGLLVLTMILIIPFNVEAKGYKATLSFFSQGGIENSGNIEVYNNIVFEKDGTKADVTYNSTDTINHINSLDKKTTFTLKKNNKAQTKNKEWYGRKYTDDSKVYFSNAETYKVTDIIKKLAIDTSIYSEGESIEVFLYANYSNVSVGNTAVKSVKLNTSSKTIKIGETYTLKATISPSDATNKKVTWKSSNTKIATVDANGKVKGIKNGKATITVTTKDKNKTAKATITVSKKESSTKENKVIIKYNVNGGVLSDYSSSAFSVSSGYVKKNGNVDFHTIDYKSSTSSHGLLDYNNSNQLNIQKNGYVAKAGAEWNTKPDGSGKNYSHSKVYKASDFCDASKGDCTVTLYVNWEKKNAIYFLQTKSSSDCILIQSGTKYGLIDIGTEGAYKHILPQLEEWNVKELEFLQITHAHGDHLGGGGVLELYDGGSFKKIVKDIKIKKLYIKNDGTKSGKYVKLYKTVINLAKENGASICDVKNSSCQSISLGDISIKLYNTSFHKDTDVKLGRKGSYENVNSIVSLVNIKGKRVYLAADIGNYAKAKKKNKEKSSDQQESIISKKVGKVDVYKVAHHGYITYNNNQDALNNLKANYAIFTSDSNYKNKETPGRLKTANKNFKGSYYTKEGTVQLIVYSDKTMKIKQMEDSWWK